MRRVIILILLFVGVQLVLPLGARGHGSQTLLTFGFFILAAYTIGEIAAQAHLPKLVGYIAAGIIFGPSVLGTVTVEATQDLAPVSSLAIALIAFLAGAELRWSEVKERGGTIVKILGSELTLSFLAVGLLLWVLRSTVPFFQGVSPREAIAFGVLFTSIAIVHSPAVVMGLLTETRASGPVARTVLGVVLLSDIVVVLLVSAAIALARALVPPQGAEVAAVTVGAVVWELGGAVIIGALLGGAVGFYLRFVRRELFLFAIIVAFFGAEVARLTHVEALLTLLTAGFVTENFSREGDGAALRHAMERSAAPVFVVFFALAGAEIVLRDVVSLWVLIIPIVLIRIMAIRGGSALGARWAATPEPAGRYLQQYAWTGLVSQAGVAIGLATVIAQVYPHRGGEIKGLFLAVLAINQTIGPVLFRYGLVRSHEVVASSWRDEETPDHIHQRA